MARERERRFRSATEAREAWSELCQVMGDLPERSRPKTAGPAAEEDADDEAETTMSSTLTATSLDESVSDGGAVSLHRKR
jgi:hypothetical protein